MSQTKSITKRVVDSLETGAMVWDANVKGFGIRRQQGRKIYVLKARINGRQRWITIGDHGAPWTPESARKEAQRLWGEIRSGVDVARLRDRNRHRLRVSELCDRFLNEYADQHKKPSSVRMDSRNIENHVKPLLGDLFVEDVTRADVDAFKRSVRDGATADAKVTRKESYRGGAVITGGTGAANRCLALLSKMFNLAELWDLRPDNSNPVRHIEKYRETKKERYLSAQEFERLAQVLALGDEDPCVVAAIRLLILTGARLSEILTLRWENVDWEYRALRLPDSKTGQKVVFLSEPAIAVLMSIPRLVDNPFVVVGRLQGQCLKNIQKPWGRIRRAVGLTDVRIHDLRHSYASVAAASGLSLPVIGKLLGHTNSSTTERYAHLGADPLRAANEAVGAKLINMSVLSTKD